MKPQLDRTTHGMHGTKTYRAWSAMKTRCFNVKSENYPNYGGRGITVCRRWMTFENFLTDMGVAPHGGTLERKDNNSNYEPGNCRWATTKEQNRNRSDTHWVEIDGVRKSLGEWCEIYGVPHQRARQRMDKCGWSAIDALTKPPREYGQA